MELKNVHFDAFGLKSLLVSVQKSEGSQRKENVDSLFLMASWNVSDG